jgi:recombination protein RecA
VPRGRPKAIREPILREGVAPSTPDVEKRIDALVTAIRKEYGEDSIHRLGEYETSIETFPTGVDALDKAIGVGGFPLAKLVQITGGESVGKSSLTNYIAAQAQRHGIVVYFLDGEMSEMGDRATAIGVNASLLTISEPETLEQAFSYMAAAIARMRKFDSPSLIILDSVAALPMQVDLERPYDQEGRRAARASFLSANLSKLVHPLKGTKIGIVFVNQVREKANAAPFEKPTYSPGGRALRHWSHLTLELRRVGQVKKGQEVIGIRSRVRVEKSKLAPPLGSCDIVMMFDGRIAEADGKGDDG